MSLILDWPVGIQAAEVAATDKPARLVIVKALYGDFSNPYATVDVTAMIVPMVKNDVLDLELNGSTFAIDDPAEGVRKQLKVDFKINGVPDTRTMADGSRLRILAAVYTNASAKLVIRKAVYGELPDGAVADVTAILSTMVSKDSLDVMVSNDEFGDPAPEKRKQLKVDYVLNGVANNRTVAEGSRLKILGSVNLDASSKLVIRKAVFGDLPDGAVADVTAILAAMISNDRLEVVASTDEFGDPVWGKPKQLKVDYVLNGVAGSRTVPERYRLRLSARPSKLVIRQAQYVALPHGKTNDVTAILATMIWDDRLDLLVSNDEFGDPAPLTIKQLRLDYEVDGVPVSKKFFEGSRLRISASDDPVPPRTSTKLVINEARYGDLPDGLFNDVTEIVESMVREDALEVVASNDIFGSVLPGKKKLRVDFTFEGKKKSTMVEEGQELKISASGKVGS